MQCVEMLLTPCTLVAEDEYVVGTRRARLQSRWKEIRVGGNYDHVLNALPRGLEQVTC
jgi:hypothetical protein